MSLHYINFRTLVHATESEEKVREAMIFAADTEDLTREEVQGYYGNPIVILEAEIRRAKEIDRFFSKFDAGDLQDILDSLEGRVDEECQVFLRVDKQEAYLGTLALVNHEDAIRVRGKIRVYPSRREEALVVLRGYLISVLEAKGASPVNS